MKAGLKATRLEANLNRIVEVILALGTCGVLWFGVQRVLMGALSPGELLVFVAYLASMYKPIRKLSALSSRLAKASVCGERIMSILDTEPTIKDAPDAVESPPLRGEILFDKVDFAYRPGGRMLQGLHFNVQPGQTIALVGESGAGKSTIGKLLFRFYDPNNGRVLIDGIDIRKFTLASLREQIAIVLQESVLFGITIRDNIAYGKLDATDEEVIAAATAACAHDFIEQLEDGYDTVVGERGATLSGGQQQRIAIARALIRNAPIVILDEPMAGLDIDSETKIQEALRQLIANKTCLLITHNLEAAAQADLIFIMEDGRIVESGRHDEIMARSSNYRSRYARKRGDSLSVANPT